MKPQEDRILRQKEKLALKALEIAATSLDIIGASLDDCSTEDLIKIFNSSVKAHKEFISDVASAGETESKSEKELSREYTDSAAKFLSKFKS